MKRSLDLGALEVSLFKRPYKNEFKCDLILSDLMKERNRQNEEHVFRNKYLDVCSCARVPTIPGCHRPASRRTEAETSLAACFEPFTSPSKTLISICCLEIGRHDLE